MSAEQKQEAVARTPEQIIGKDALLQLVFEGYAVVAASSQERIAPEGEWTEERLREEAKRRGWYTREHASVPDFNGGWRHPFSVTVSSRELLELLAATPAAVGAAPEPEGEWKAVPIEPTLAMIHAYCEVQNDKGIAAFANARLIWPAMLAAAPERIVGAAK